ncbi:MAG: amino acid adenylation domain-containing protein [Candidatus Eremiobacteraeota bacterium]|nr:amino acid adenylation domain-containing protein [Candidatus Eremiobacteraeota bacterium]
MTERPYSRDVCLHELIEKQAAASPDATALEFEDEALTYAELNARANRLARHLRAQGVGPERLVAVCMERSAELTIALLAVLKAGGAYVPLDPRYPPARLEYMLQDSAPALVLVHGAVSAEVRETLARGNVPAIDVARDARRWAAESGADLERGDLSPANLCYVIYTSGSTGQPKGAMNEHRAVVNRLLWMDAEYPIGADDAVLQKTPFTFDVSVWEFWWPLLSGARLVMARPGGHQDPAYLAELVQRRRITAIHFVPSMLTYFVEHPGSARCSTLRHVFCSGEALPRHLAVRLYERLPQVQLSNLYGPTETAIEVTAWRCPRENVPARIPIGRPIAGARIYVLDETMQQVPRGTVGELHIGGVPVGRGYLRRPELTAQRFVLNPFVPGERVYKTGDLARFLPDGTVEYVGRNDFQVKIRGFRIELGEIEARLAAYRGVRESVVVALDDRAGEKRLVAYYTAPEHVHAGALRRHLLAALPDYMVPSAFVHLEAMPLGASGKLDRNALPAPDDAAYASAAYEEPVGPVETALAAIWSELLGVERVGRRDNFFALGGHSLLAMRVLSQVRDALGLELRSGSLFSHPVLADLAHALEQERSARPAIVPADRAQRLPLSFEQERLWFLTQLDPRASLAYHVPIALPLSGPLNVRALRRALDAIVARHEALRTTFVALDGAPAQRIGPPNTRMPLIEHDLRGLDGPFSLRARIAGEEMNAPFDLATGPLVRARLITVADDDHVLLVTAHHAVFDGWSAALFSRELAALYGAFRTGQPNQLPPPAIQPVDHAAWQRRTNAGREQLAYWRDALREVPAVVELPADRPRPARQDYAGAHVPFEIDAELTAKLKSLSRRHGATLFMTLLTAWGALLSRLAVQDVVVVGTAVANRTRPELEPLLGFFVNTLALRLEYGGGPTVGEALARVKAQVGAAHEHQDAPFGQVVEAVNPPRSLAYTPLFQTMLVWQSWDANAIFPASNLHAAKTDLVAELCEDGDRIRGVIVYATALFDRETVVRYGEYFRRLLVAMTAGDAQAIGRLPLLAASERRRALVDWNATARTYPAELCVHELVEAQVARSPHAVAVDHEGMRLSYAELNAQANRLARHLRARGVGPGVRVAVCMERSTELVVALLAVLKAGGAYVPLDPGYPLERLAYLVEDAAPALLLAHDAVPAGVRAALRRTGVPALDVAADAPRWADESEENLARAGLLSSHLAYVIYTSGSTGKPKGAMNEHRGVVNRLLWMQDEYTLGADDAVLQKTPFSFDVSVWEFFLPLLSGARLVMARAGGHRDPDYLVRVVREARVTMMHAVPSMLGFFVDAAHAERCTTLEHVICSGEALPRALAERFSERLPFAQLSNLYGPTEAAVDVTAWRCPARALPPNIPIGRPIANTRAYVLDAHRELVPAGVTGELYIGGVQVGRGYLNRPELTAERFVANPFVAGDRLYKTGDLARHLADGTLEYLGRNDFQVKIRGFRVELGEIEARLAAHPGVREAVVVALDDGGEKRLAAYFTAPDEIRADELRNALSTALPEHMVPSAYVQLESFPLTPNGKLDRAALPAPGGAQRTRRFEEPVGPVETALAAIWRDLLKLERVGRHDNFFELGGHSLLMIHAIQRMRGAGLHAEISDLFVSRTLANAATITTQLGEVRI